MRDHHHFIADKHEAVSGNGDADRPPYTVRSKKRDDFLSAGKTSSYNGAYVGCRNLHARNPIFHILATFPSDHASTFLCAD